MPRGVTGPENQGGLTARGSIPPPSSNTIEEQYAIRRTSDDDGVMRFEDFQDRAPEMIARIRHSEQLTGEDMATRIGAPPCALCCTCLMCAKSNCGACERHAVPSPGDAPRPA